LAHRVPAGLSDRGPLAARAGRKFSFTVGTAFLVLAAIATWRDHPTLATVLAPLGGALLLGGLVIPARMRAVERVWMQFALLLSKVTTPVFMGVVYFLIITPTGFLRRTLVRSPMRPRAEKDSFWVASAPMSRDRLRQQF
jgi:hypothetical protein